MNENNCYTCFTITGDFDPDIITKKLGLTPEKTWKIGDLRRNGTAYDFALWEFGRCDQYDALAENQMHKTIDPLMDKIQVLNEIRNTFDVAFSLAVVPTVYSNQITPCLSPSMKVIDFCHATRTEIDIDLYVIG